MPLQCFDTVHLVCLCCVNTVAVCNGNSVLVRHFFFFFQFQIVATVPCGTAATVVTFSFFIYSICTFFSFIYIVLLHNKFHNIFTNY